MTKPIITIIGLGTTGASMGLGLQREEGNFEIVGHDKNPEAAQAAKRQGAVQRTEWNLFRACEGADMILVAVPLNELSGLFELISQDLKAGGMVFALTNLMQPAIDIAARHLPEHAHFVAGHPVLSGVGGALTMRADLFDEVTFALAPGLNTEPGAVQLASDLVERVGATPLFVDAYEHDGIIAGVEQLPQVLAAALMRVSSRSPGWREARRLAGRQFAQATELGHGAEPLFEALRTNRENLLYRIRQLQEELSQWHDLLAAEDGIAANGVAANETAEGSVMQPEPASGVPDKSTRDQENDKKQAKDPLLAALETAVAARTDWEAQAILKNWEEAPERAQVESGEGSGLFRQMFFGNLMGKRKEGNSQSNKR